MKFKKLTLTLLSSLAMAPIAYGQQGSKPIDLKAILQGSFAARGAGAGIRSLADGVHYSSIDSKHSAIVRYSFATGQAVDTLFNIAKARDCNFKQFDNYDISADGNHILLYTDTEPIYRRSSRSQVYHYDVRRNRVESLSTVGGKVMIPTFSPDGRMVAFVRDGNIFIKKFDFDTEVQVTNDAAPNKIMNGTTDWVYEEEFKTTKLMSWSEDGAYLAYARTDESKVQQYEIPIYGQTLYPKDYTYKYPKAGTENSKLSVYVYNVVNRENKPVILPEGSYDYIPRIEYIGRNSNLAVLTLNRQQNHFRLFYVNSKTLLPKAIYQEREDAYINSNLVESLRFTNQGFTLLSERDGYAHLYFYSDTGSLLRRATQGKYDVTDFYGVDSKGNAYYQCADENPMGRNIYRVDTKGHTTRLGVSYGTNNAIFSPTFDYYIHSVSTLNTPLKTSVYKTGSKEALRVLEDNSNLQEKLHGYRFSTKEFTKITTTSFGDINAWVIKPTDFDPGKRYPVVMVQYSGPGSQMVLDRYSFGWEYYLASRGYVVVCADGPGTGARGEEWCKQTYMKLGLKESQGQIEVAQSLAKLPWVDGARIGLWGWSFGGYNTLMSLAHGGKKVFKLGIAVAPVTDWKFYDSIYTERYMRTPKENPQGYEASSVLAIADKIESRLLIMHGSADDNVHVQNTMVLTPLLIERGFPFDMAIYTDKDHSIRGGNTSYHIYNKMAQYILDNL